MTFDEYLSGKKIDSQKFREQEPVVWASWERDFAQLHPASFTAQKLYLINPLRRKYHLTPPSEGKALAGEAKAGVKAARPVVRPKPKM